MPLDPQVQAALSVAMAAGVLPSAQKSVAENRAALDALMRNVPKHNAPISRVENRTIPGSARPIPVRIYTPNGSGPFPVLLWFHGGGWVLGSLDGYDDLCRALAHLAGCVVVAVDYRLAPEHKFPAAPDDCWAAACWVGEHAAEIGGDARKLAVAGDSAGGNLTAVVSLMARDRGRPNLACQVLIYPATDRPGDTPSIREFADGHAGLPRDSMVWFWKQYVASEAKADHPYAAPLRSRDLKNLPPALIIAAECDVLRDEGEAYLMKLRQADVPAVGTRYLGMNHGFFSLSALLPAGGQALRQVRDFLRTTRGE